MRHLAQLLQSVSTLCHYSFLFVSILILFYLCSETE